MKKNFSLAFSAVSLVATNSVVNAFETDNHLSTEQLSYYEEKAKSDDKIVFELALIYLNGSQGVSKDVEKAIKS